MLIKFSEYLKQARTKKDGEILCDVIKKAYDTNERYFIFDFDNYNMTKSFAQTAFDLFIKDNEYIFDFSFINCNTKNFEIMNDLFKKSSSYYRLSYNEKTDSLLSLYGKELFNYDEFITGLKTNYIQIKEEEIKNNYNDDIKAVFAYINTIQIRIILYYKNENDNLTIDELQKALSIDDLASNIYSICNYECVSSPLTAAKVVKYIHTEYMKSDVIESCKNYLESISYIFTPKEMLLAISEML